MSRAGGRVEIGPWRPGDEESICRLFAHTFGRPKSVERWRWQFLGQGLEPPVMVARDEDGEVVAHFGGVPMRTGVDGRARLFAVAVDSMVAPERRAGLKRPGLFAAVVERWVEHFCVHGPVELGYGLANREALRIGRRLLGYSPLDGAALFARRLDDAADEAADDDAEVQAGPLPPSDHDELWARAGARHEVAACRDGRFMRWRYSEAPGGGYAFLGARRGGRLRVSAVFKPDYVVPDSGALVDLLWDGEDPADLAACVRDAERRALAAGLAHLVVLLPADCAEARVLAARAYSSVRFGLTLVARSFRPAHDLARLAPRLFFTGGDFDLV